MLGVEACDWSNDCVTTLGDTSFLPRSGIRSCATLTSRMSFLRFFKRSGSFMEAWRVRLRLSSRVREEFCVDGCNDGSAPRRFRLIDDLEPTTMIYLEYTRSWWFCYVHR